MKFRHVYISNLPNGIEEEELEEYLVTTFEDFRQARDQGRLVVNKFVKYPKKNDEQIETTAVVSGVEVDFEKLHYEVAGKFIQGPFGKPRNVVLKPDWGDERHDNGDFKYPLPPAKKRWYDFLSGESVRITDVAFQSEFMQKLEGVWEYSSEFFVCRHLDYNVLANIFEGCVLQQSIPVDSTYCDKRTTKCIFASALDALQAIVNRNDYVFPEDGISAITVTNQGRTKFADIVGEGGIGSGGELLNLRDYKFEMHYVPFTDLSSNIFDTGKINAIKSKCWNCNQPYEIIGIDVNLGYLAAKCSICVYDRSLDILDNRRAYSFENETFTRLVAGPLKDKKIQQWVVAYEPMRPYYDSARHYRNIVLPLLAEEWHYSTNGFKEAHTEVGNFQRPPNFIQHLRNDDGESSVYTGRIFIRRTEFWSDSNFNQIGDLTLEFETTMAFGENVRVMTEPHAGILHRIEDAGDQVLLRVRFSLRPNEEPSQMNLGVTVIPKPIKTEYEGMKQLVNKLANKPRRFPVFELFLTENLPYEPEPHVPAIHVGNFPERDEIFKMIKPLNPEQDLALSRAQKNPISVVDGPPGTGKTFFSTLALILFHYNSGRPVLGTAPSNFAADGLAKSISKELMKRGLKKTIIRVYSRKREIKYRLDGNHPDIGDLSATLGQRVLDHPQYLQDLPQNIVDAVLNNDMEDLWDDEIKMYEGHVAEIEGMVLDTADFIISTVGCLSDRRVKSWNSERWRAELPTIETLLVDEAGMLLQPQLLHVLDLWVDRIILVGDPKQLSPVVNSFAAKLAGYGFSLLEWFDISNVPIARTMLLEQRRMAPAIRAIVSEMSYFGRLYDYEDVIFHHPRIQDGFRKAFQLNHSVLVVTHDFVDQKIGESRRNVAEARLVAAIVRKLTDNNIKQKWISTLVLYKAQRNYLEHIAPELEPKTVDSVQGRENKVVVLSMVRVGFGIGFADNVNRLNVAVSRAQKKMIIVMNIGTFEKHGGQCITKFLGLLRTHGVIKDAKDIFPDM